jgi:hypothetical protein
MDDDDLRVIELLRVAMVFPEHSVLALHVISIYIYMRMDGLTAVLCPAVSC